MLPFDVLPVVMLVLLLSWPAFNVLMTLLASVPRPVPKPRPGPGRNYWIIIPACNEAKVIRNTVEAALALNSRVAPVRVLVVDDASDDETPELLGQLGHPRLKVIRREYPNARQGKGEALNEAYRHIRDTAVAAGEVDSTIIGVIDGDGRGEPHMIEDVVDRYFSRPELGALQCRVRIHNRSRLLGLLQDLEFACVANASQSFRDLVDSVGMGGNGQFVRLTHLMRYGDAPWSDCLVDDLELGLRLHLAGVRIRYTPHAAINQQAIVEVRPLLGQRARWAQGNLQCAQYVAKLVSSRQVGSIGLLDYVAYLVAPWLAVPVSLLVLGIIAVVLAGLATGSSFGGIIAAGDTVPPALALWITMVFLPGLLWGLWHRLHLGDEPLWRCLLAGLCYPFFLILGIVATWRGMARHLAGRSGWVKTERLEEPVLARADAGRPAVTRLRRRWVPIGPRQGGYAAAADASTVDLHRFRPGLARAWVPQQDVEALQACEPATGRWQGAPFGPLESRWLDRDEALRPGEPAGLVVTLTELAASYPLDERVAGQLALSLHSAGRTDEALATIQRTRRRLAEELGIDPSARLRDVEAAILRRDGAVGPPVLPADFAGRSGEVAALTEALRVGGEPCGVHAVEGRAEMLGTLLSGRRSLIVLDDAAAEGQARPTLPGGCGCDVLVTARSRLNELDPHPRNAQPGAHH